MSLFHFLKHGRFDHEFQNGRDAEGKLTAECVLCGYARLVLGDPIETKGPAHRPRVDQGAVKTKAQLRDRKPCKVLPHSPGRGI
jgi:hypothetical protein